MCFLYLKRILPFGERGEEMKKLIVVSADALVYEDLELLKDMPVTGHLIREGAMVKRLRSIYPTLTYPNHTTMATGRYADRHGVVNNTEYTAGVKEPAWNFTHDNVKCRDIFDAAKKAGLKTAAVGWPVTGNHGSIDYLVDEVWPREAEKQNDKQAFLDAMMETGTPDWLLESCVAQHIDLRVPRRSPESSWFNTYVFCDIIRAYNPDFCMLHVGNIDNARHEYGVFNEHVSENVRMLDDFMREIVSAVSSNGMLYDTDFVITSDHGQIDTDRCACPNVLLEKAGLIETDEEGRVLSWKAWSFEAGTSAQLVVSRELPEEERKAVKEKILKLFTEEKEKGDCGFEDILTVESTEEDEHLSGDFDFVLETDGHTSFGNDWNGEYLRENGKISGKHGHNPDKGPWATFIGCGPSFLKGAVIDAAPIVDTAPTYAAVLGADLPETDGHALMGILK